MAQKGPGVAVFAEAVEILHDYELTKMKSVKLYPTQ